MNNSIIIQDINGLQQTAELLPQSINLMAIFPWALFLCILYADFARLCLGWGAFFYFSPDFVLGKRAHMNCFGSGGTTQVWLWISAIALELQTYFRPKRLPRPSSSANAEPELAFSWPKSLVPFLVTRFRACTLFTAKLHVMKVCKAKRPSKKKKSETFLHIKIDSQLNKKKKKKKKKIYGWYLVCRRTEVHGWFCKNFGMFLKA